MTGDLIAPLVGLALLDSVNASTLFLVMVGLLTARSPIRSAGCYLVGAVVSFLGLAIGPGRRSPSLRPRPPGTDRFLSGTAQRSVPLAVGLTAAAGASVGVALIV